MTYPGLGLALYIKDKHPKLPLWKKKVRQKAYLQQGGDAQWGVAKIGGGRDSRRTEGHYETHPYREKKKIAGPNHKINPALVDWG